MAVIRAYEAFDMTKFLLKGGTVSDTNISNGNIKVTLLSNSSAPWNAPGVYSRGLNYKVGEDTYFTIREANVDGDYVYRYLNSRPDAETELAAQYLAGNDLIYGSSKNDILLGGRGADQINGNAGVDTIYGNEDNDIIFGSGGNDRLVGGYGDDTLDGGLDNDTLLGESGNDILNGGDGENNLAGGTGNDTYIVTARDKFSEEAGAGVDTVKYNADYVLQDNFENLVLLGSGDFTGTGNAVNNEITGNSGNNVLDGKEGSDSIYGEAGDDTLTGGDGDDLLDGGSGKDELGGGKGDDIYVIDTQDIVTEFGGGGDDTVKIEGSYELGAFLEDLILLGSENFYGIGNALDNMIRGNSGDNELSGAAGDDVLIGNEGNDTYVLTDLDKVVEAAGEGTDTVKSRIDYTLTDHVENLTLTDDAISGWGNELNNLLLGNLLDNFLYGLGGNDILRGAEGNDVLAGGLGEDSLRGGSGFDTYRFDTALSADNFDTITYYSPTEDIIELENSVFASLAVVGGLGVDNFRASASGNAADADDFILYETDTGELYYDPDGSGSQQKILFAITDNRDLNLNASDFMVT